MLWLSSGVEVSTSGTSLFGEPEPRRLSAAGAQAPPAEHITNAHSAQTLRLAQVLLTIAMSHSDFVCGVRPSEVATQGSATGKGDRCVWRVDGKCLLGTSTFTARVTCTTPGCCLITWTKPSMGGQRRILVW